MICKICGEDINEKGQDNISTISGYPICEDCKDDIMCAECYDSFTDLYYIEEWDKILCRHCLIEEAEKRGEIHSVTHYYTLEYHEICSDADLDPVIDHLKELFDIQEVNNGT